MLVIKNAKISTGEGNDTKEANIIIEGEKITAVELIAKDIPKDAEIIDATGMLAIPGGIDPHVHFDTPGYESREDFAHGTKAAAAGGTTTIIDMPDTSIPPVVNKGNLNKKLAVIRNQAHIDFALWGGVSSNAMLEEDWFDSMTELWEAGVVGFKTYLISSMDRFKELSIIQLGQVMQYASKLKALVGLHAEERDIIRTREAILKKNNKNELFDYYFSRSDPAEKQGVAIGVHLAKQTGCRLHIVHLASSEGLAVIKQGKDLQVDISAETCPHYLAFTYKDFDKYGSLIKTSPVVKTEKDKKGLWEGLKNGDIDFVATDHAPCPIEEKETGSAWTDYAGMPGVELRLPYLFSEGYIKKKLTLAKLVDITSGRAAERFGLSKEKGAILAGMDADIVLIDPKKKWKVEGKNLHSKAKWTPFEDREFTGKIEKTILRGKVIYDAEKGILSEAKYGRWIKRT